MKDKKAIANIYYDLFEFMTVYNHKIWCNVNLLLPLNHLGVLLVLEQQKFATGSQLTETLAISKQQLWAILNKLTGDGLIQKEVHTTDRRYVKFSLTSKGQDFLIQHRKYMRNHFMQYVQEVDKISPEQFAKSVQTVKDVVEALMPPGKEN